ncbi:MAG TPA: hydrogenase maturation protease [Anaeromyxobacteraceae bacterium]|nr:hydrogenase maturation protease [Anaeromyxobacteraceae bacterium]
MSAAHRRLVVACGNPLRRDDGAGPAAAEGLGASGVAVVIVHQLAPELADDVAAADAVVFLDARAGPTPGAVETRRVQPAPPPSTLGHACSPEEVLALAALVHGVRPRAALVTVQGADFGLGEGLSPEVAAALPALRAAARRFLDQSSRDQDSVSSTSGAFEL